MEIVIVGLSHKSAPVEVREKISFAEDVLDEGLKSLSGYKNVTEAMILSTCNRVEICAISPKKDAAVEDIASFLSEYHSVERKKIDPHLYTFSGEEAIGHMFKVASSLDSMVVGEPQILGQVKDAFTCAINAKSTGNVLNRLLHKTFSVAKRVRTETRIATSAVSIPYAAVELAKKIFGDLEGKTVMLIGAGEMAELAARHLLNSGVKHIFVTNRTFERAEKLAEVFEGSAVQFDDLHQQMELADIIISSTGAPTTILGKKDVTGVIKKRRNRPMFFIDIAVPRDIETSVNDIENVYLYDIDDLEGVVQANMKARGKEAAKAEKIVLEEVDQFNNWMMSSEAFPTIVMLKEWAETIRKDEVSKTLKRMHDLSEVDQKRIEAMTEAILNKILHRPISRMKNGSQTHDGKDLVEAARKIFGLDD
ncbi:MAG: glutamyl-tRNA reductase [bacterium]